MMSDPRNDRTPAEPQQDDAELSDEALEQVAGGLPQESLTVGSDVEQLGLADFDGAITID
jgi:hypothetical protein